jgi:hypothetical protein
MRILYREIYPPRVQTLIQQFRPSLDPTSVPMPAQVMLHVTTPSFLRLYPGQQLPLILVSQQLYLGLVRPLSSISDYTRF